MKTLLLVAGLTLAVLALILIQVRCPACGGTGRVAVPSAARKPCPTCHGRGTIEPKLAPGPGVQSTFTHAHPTCPACNGTGYRKDSEIEKSPCPRCLGAGSVPLYRRLLARSER